MKQKILSFISFLIVLIIYSTLNILPRTIALLIGRAIGIIIYYLLPIRKNIAKKNIEEAFQDKSSKYHKNILKKTYIHFGMVLVDFLRMKRLNSINLKKVININEKTQKILKENKGAIIMTGHLGNWEYFLPAIGLSNFPFCIVAKEIKNIYLNKLFLSIRNTGNVKIIFKGEKSSTMLNIIKQKIFLGLASDQNAGHKGTKVNFLNGKLSVPKGAALFQIKTKAPILIGYCILNQNRTYDFNLSVLDIEELNTQKSDGIYNINRKFAVNLENMIRKYPEQYFWFHKMRDKKKYR